MNYMHYLPEYLSGDTLAIIGSRYKRSRQAVSLYLIKHHREEYEAERGRRKQTTSERARLHAETRYVRLFFRQLHGHFNGSQYTQGCRCDNCKEANRVRVNTWYHADIERGREVWARWQRENPDKVKVYRERWIAKKRLDPGSWNHGKVFTYSSLGCRCRQCKDAVNAQQRAHYARNREKILAKLAAKRAERKMVQ